jgi:hypothetical protein
MVTDVIIHDTQESWPETHGVSIEHTAYRRPLVSTAERKDSIHLFSGWVQESLDYSAYSFIIYFQARVKQ